MKTLAFKILGLFLFFINSIYSQDYKFDKIVKNVFSSSLNPNQEITNLFNSEDDSYNMHIFNRNDSILANICDMKKNQIHYFFIDKSDSLKVYYINTKNFIPNINDYKYEFIKFKKKKEYNEITMKILNNKGKKIGKYKFKIKESVKNYFYFFKLTSLETNFFDSIIPPFNFTIIEAKGINTSGLYVKYKLESIEDININIKIPN